jgi:hypothetical protein
VSGETEQNVSGWTTDTLHIYMQVQIDDLIRMLDERYVTQTKALDAAFVAQQTAMQTAFKSADTAVAAALLSAEKAVTKAEVASEKRFESVNEFRAQLNDQAATLLSRAEADARLQALGDKIESIADRSQERADLSIARIAELELRISSRLDVTQGRSLGLNAGWVYLLAGVGAIGTIVSIIIIIVNR